MKGQLGKSPTEESSERWALQQWDDGELEKHAECGPSDEPVCALCYV